MITSHYLCYIQLILFLKAGMWGFYNERNRTIANKVYRLLVDREISYNYKRNNKRGMDQAYPIRYIFPFIREVTMTHDSYFCMTREYKTGEKRPFSVRRDGACWIGLYRVGRYVTEYDCKTGNATLFKCPVECRPKEHQDWIHC